MQDEIVQLSNVVVSVLDIMRAVLSISKISYTQKRDYRK
jgi:hypothetical protein